MSVKNKLRKRANKIIANKISPNALRDIKKNVETVRNLNEVGEYALGIASNATSVAESANGVLRPAGAVAGFINRPLNAIYNNYIKVWIGENNEAIEYTLKQEESTH